MGRKARVRGISGRSVRLAGLSILVIACTSVTWFTLDQLYHTLWSRQNLPDVGAFTRFEFPTIGHVYDVNGQPLMAFAREYREITQYRDIPPIVRDAILAAEDKHFFSHDGVDYSSIPRVISKIRVGVFAGRLATGGRDDNTSGQAMFPQGGSTITQQLVRGCFLRAMTSQENSYTLQNVALSSRALSWWIGERNVNMVLRKREEIRLSLWLERQMIEEFGSKRRAKEEIFARYVSFLYMGHGQYGFARASQYYFGRPLSRLTGDDADRAALLAGIAKSPREYAPNAPDTAKILRRRNQILGLMAENGFITRDETSESRRRPLPTVARRTSESFHYAAAVEHVLSDLLAHRDALGLDDLRHGRIQVFSTVDVRIQDIANEALEHGLEHYEERHPAARGLSQGAVVVLKNRDGSVLAETGGRRVYGGRVIAFSDFNRVRESLRQPGSAMKAIVYLAAFRNGNFTLDTLVPDAPISVPDGTRGRKWISNYDSTYKGMIPVRQALAESRNAATIWIADRIGIETILSTSRSLGVETPLHPYAPTALGASEMTLLELATAYRAIASGILVPAHVIRQVTRGSDVALEEQHDAGISIDDEALSLIQEGLRGVVRIPSGTAHALDAYRFPIAVMGKTGTSSGYRDALFVGSTYGVDGITVAVRIGFDDARSLGTRETGGRVALPIFEELMLRVYGDQLVGPVPDFPPRMEASITRYLSAPAVKPDSIVANL
jgi:penicillin-binding protein 1A